MLNPRLITAVHEAGHAVVAEHGGITVTSIAILNFQTGATDLEDRDPPPHAQRALVAVAGFAAVGVVLGPKAEAQNRANEAHEEWDSDLFRAMTHAGALGVADDDLHTYLLGLENEVRALLRTNPYKGMLIAIAEPLWDADDSRTAQDRMSGAEVRHLMATTRTSWLEAGSPD